MADIKPRRPASARPRPAAAAEETNKEPPAPVEDDGIPNDDDETWLFSVKDPMTTAEITKMGFTNVILLNADRWRGAEDYDGDAIALASSTAAADIHYCFGMKGPALAAIDTSTRSLIEEQLVVAMCGKGDLLIIIQKADRGFGEAGMVVTSRLVDSIETAYNRASEDAVDDLAGVSLVLEGCNLPLLTVSWDDGSTRSLEITAA